MNHLWTLVAETRMSFRTPYGADQSTLFCSSDLFLLLLTSIDLLVPAVRQLASLSIMATSFPPPPINTIGIPLHRFRPRTPP